jgi:hypothetical protein
MARGGPESVLIWWAPSVDPDVRGYNLYAATDGASFYRVNEDGLITTPAFLDAPLVNGITYFYCVTAVVAPGYESPPSAIAWARPTPESPPYLLRVRVRAPRAKHLAGQPVALRVFVTLAGMPLPGAQIELTLPSGEAVALTTNSRGRAVFRGYAPPAPGLYEAKATVGMQTLFAEDTCPFEASAPP